MGPGELMLLDCGIVITEQHHQSRGALFSSSYCRLEIGSISDVFRDECINVVMQKWMFSKIVDSSLCRENGPVMFGVGGSVGSVGMEGGSAGSAVAGKGSVCIPCAFL